MDAITFLSVDEVLKLHDAQLELFGGSSGVRDMGLLESALAQPGQLFGGSYLHEDLAAMAAAYLYHIARNHPFIDGNKRTGLDAAVVFLELNGFELNAGDDSLVELVLSVAEGKAEKPAVAQFFRDHITKKP